MASRISTGIEYLDQQIGGGLVPGRVVCLRTAPDSQGELLLRQVAKTNGALYLSTARTDAAVAEWLAGNGSTVDVEYAGIDGLTPRGGDAVREWVERAAGWPDGRTWPDPGESDQIEAVSLAVNSSEGNVVIDPINPLEGGEEQAYLRFLQLLQQRIRATESLAFLHVVKSEKTPAGRWLTLHLADEVWDVSVNVNNMRVEFLLTVTKSRSDDVPERQLKLDLGEDVYIDTSREIA